MKNNQPKVTKAADVYLSLNEFSNLTGFTFLTVKKRLESLTATEGSHSSLLYALADAIPLLYSKEDDTLTELKLRREREETRLAAARAQKIELENGVKEKTIIPLEEAEREFAELVVNFKSKILAIPSKAAFDVLQYKKPHDVESYLKSLIVEALDELTRNAR